MTITCTTYAGVPRDLRKNVEQLVRWLPTVTDIVHPIHVMVVPHPAIDAGGTFCFGCFYWPKKRLKRNTELTIAVAGGVRKVLANEGLTHKDDGLSMIEQTLLHEFVHYEQYRDGRQPTERGVNLRAKNLQRRYRAEHGMPPLVKGSTVTVTP